MYVGETKRRLCKGCEVCDKSSVINESPVGKLIPPEFP